MRKEFNLTKRHTEQYRSQIDISLVGNITFSLDYELRVGSWRLPCNHGRDHTFRKMNLKFYKGRKAEGIFESWLSYEGKLIVSSRDHLCSGLIGPCAIHYLIVRDLRRRPLQLSTDTMSFFNQSSRKYYAELRRHHITEQILDYIKRRRDASISLWSFL